MGKNKKSVSITAKDSQIIIGSKNKAKNKTKKNTKMDTHTQLSGNHEQDIKEREPNGWAKLILPLIVAIIVAIIYNYPFNVEKNDDESSFSSPQPIVQTFSNKEKIEEYSQFKYIECTLTSDPILSGYQVKPYPYIAVFKSEEWTYIPILGLYTQDQYSADNNGVCKLKRENITSQLQDISTEVNKENGEDYHVGCLLVIEYVANDGLRKNETYELRIGQLSIPDEDKAIKIINANSDDAQIKINVATWPSNKDQIIEVLHDI